MDLFLFRRQNKESVWIPKGDESKPRQFPGFKIRLGVDLPDSDSDSGVSTSES